MKFCTRIFSVKKEYKSAIAPWWVAFSGKLFHLYSFKYWSHQFFWILSHYCNKKKLFNRNDIVFEMDFSSFSSAWEFSDTNWLPNFLRLPRVNLVTSASFCYKKRTKKIIFKIAPVTRLHLGSSWNQQDWVVNSLFGHLTKSCFIQLDIKFISILTLKWLSQKCLTYREVNNVRLHWNSWGRSFLSYTCFFRGLYRLGIFSTG